MRRIITAIVSGILLAACVQAGPAGAAEGLRIAVPAIPKSPDPHRDPAGQMLPIFRLAFEGLVRADESGRPTPVLAESWKLINDTTWQFVLRRGVRFQDGEPFNADVVKWNIERAQDPKNSVFSARVKPIVSVEVVNEHTVIVKTRTPFASLLGNLMPILMLPPAYYTRVGPQGFVAAPVGTGPYRIVTFKPDAQVRMERHDGYWGPKPALTSVTFRMLPEAASRIAALQAGEIDLSYHVPPESIDQVRAAGFTVVPVHIGQAYLFILAQPRTTIEPLRSKLVRQAINYAVDKDALIKAFTKGMARRLEGQLVGPDGVGYTEKVKAYPYDPGKARALLREAGYPNGFKVKMTGTSGRYPEDKEVSQAVAQYLRQVGIDVELSLVEANVWTDRFLNYKLDPIWIIGLNYLPSMDHTFASVHFTNDPSTRQWFGDDRLNELYTKQVTTLDPAQRKVALERFAEYLREEAVALFLYQIPLVLAASPRVKGLRFFADYTVDLTGGQVGR